MRALHWWFLRRRLRRIHPLELGHHGFDHGGVDERLISLHIDHGGHRIASAQASAISSSATDANRMLPELPGEVSNTRKPRPLPTPAVERRQCIAPRHQR